jgi:hypothetical protein
MPDTEAPRRSGFIVALSRVGAQDCLSCAHCTRRPGLEHQIAEIERGAAEVKWHDAVELVIARAETHVRREVAFNGVDRVPRWPHGSCPSSTANGGLDVVLSDAGVDHARQVACAVRAKRWRSVPAECAVECHGDQRETSAPAIIKSRVMARLPFRDIRASAALSTAWYICQVACHLGWGASRPGRGGHLLDSWISAQVFDKTSATFRFGRSQMTSKK